DTSLIQTNVVRVMTPKDAEGRRQVYIPVYRQTGSSTLDVVKGIESAIPGIKTKISHPDIDMHVVMDQSIYVRQSIASLVEEGILGAVLCSLVILIFLGEWRMTVIAILTIPISIFSALIWLYYTGNTINVMTLAGLALAIGPLVDSAIICLENTHRHLGLGAKPKEAAFLGASEVAMPELIASLCTLLVLLPLAMMPGLGAFLFKPMFLAVAFAMTIAYILSRTFVPVRCAAWLRGHEHHDNHGHEHHSEQPKWLIARMFAKWEALIEVGIAAYVRVLNRVLRVRRLVVGLALATLATTVVTLGPGLRREFFPEVDAGAFEIAVRAA